jgi:hypothetical protein
MCLEKKGVKNMLAKLILWFVEFSLFSHKIVRSEYGGKTEFVNDTDLKQLEAYNNEVFSDYLSYIDKFYINKSLSEINICEVGTGKSLGVALRFLQMGAHVTTIDRFDHVQDRDLEIENYCRKHGYKFEKFSDSEFLIDGKRLSILVTPLEYLNLDLVGKFDLVVSRATFEHLENVKKCFDNLYQYSNSNACHIHEIDHRDHGIFSHFKIVTNMWFHNVSNENWALVISAIPGIPNKIDRFEFERYFREAGFRIKGNVSKFDNSDEVSIQCVQKISNPA